MTKQSSIFTRPRNYFLLILIVYAVLLIPTLAHQGISWDEQTDIDIARAYLSPNGWFVGSHSDPSQTRLPMAAVALVYELFNTQDIYTARVVSALVGALTLVGIYLYCRREYDGWTGVLASALLATSPFFLSFARVAFTETDVYVACAFAWFLVCMSNLRAKGTVGWLLASGILLGLALSGKFTAIVIVPAVVLEMLLHPRTRPTGTRLSKRERVVSIALLLLTVASTVFALVTVRTARQADALLVYLPPLVCWLATVGWALRCRQRIVKPLPAAVAIVLLALVTFVLLPPDHLTNPAIFNALGGRASNEMAFNPAFMFEAAVLHLGCTLFKSSPLIGLGLLITPFAALVQWLRRKASPGDRLSNGNQVPSPQDSSLRESDAGEGQGEGGRYWTTQVGLNRTSNPTPELVSIRLSVLMVFCYAAGLLILPIAQTFYAVPLLPVLAILLASQFRRLLSAQKRIALALGAVALIWLAVDLVLCYPDYNLNGYQYLGERYLAGRTTLGYRAIVQTPSDGVDELVQWAVDNVEAGETVVVCINPWHIVKATAPNPDFQLYHLRDRGLTTRPDVVLIHINCQIDAGWRTHNPSGDIFKPPYSQSWLETHYEQVGAITRAFDLEIGSMWRKKTD